MAPRLLDLFCCAGGAGRGYRDAGFYVTGVDLNKPSTEYGGDEFVQADAFDFLADHLHEFDFIHASPPCQNFSALTQGNRARGWKDDHEDLIEPLRVSLSRTTVPIILENVPGAPLRKDLVLCGLSFDLKVFRHRVFEFINCDPIPAPPHVSHKGHRVKGWSHGVYYEGDMYGVHGTGGDRGTVSEWQEAMGIDWTRSKQELAEAIPPAYTRYIGTCLLNELAA